MTSGYKTLMGEIKMTYGDNDPWGTTMGWLFGLAEVAYVEFGELVPEFRPSPMLETRADLEGYEQYTILDLLDHSLITQDDIRNVFKVMTRYDNILRAAGLNY